MTAKDWVGKTIGGRYQIEALLGQGGMSAVYRATDPNLRRRVAIKIIHSHLSDDPKFVDRFKEEAAAVARLRHPNIVQVHDFNIDNDTYYMVMEYLVGETLQARLRRLNAANRHMPLNEALNLCIQLCEATGYAHKHELIHRDIKPANIMLNVNGQAILMDFGIVKIIGGDYHTATGATVGTAKYMSPEQIRSERVDERADVYSLGVTLYEMLSGQPPYMADSVLTLIMMVLNDPLPDLSEARPGIPGSLQVVVQKALAKEPSERYQTMAEMADALRQVQAELASSYPEPALTQVDESQAVAAIPVVEAMPATVVDAHTENLILETSEMDRSESESIPVELKGVNEKIPLVETLQGQPGEAISIPIKPAESHGGSTARLTSRRVLLILAGSLVLVVLLTLGVLFLNARKPPSLQLMPISSSSDTLNADTAQAAVRLGRWETNSFIEELTFSPDSSSLGTANNRDQARFSPYRYYNGLWQVQAGLLENYFRGHTQWVYDVAFSSDGQLLGSVSDDGSALLWQVRDNTLANQIESTHGGLTGLAFSPNNLLLATSSWDGIVSVWQVSNGNLLRTLQGNEYGLKDVNFSPDGTLLAAASDDNTILIWRVNDGQLIHTLKDHTAPVYKVIFSPDGTLLASASEDHTVKIWGVNDSNLVHTLLGHNEAVYDAAFSSDGSLLASGSGDGVLRLWKVNDGTLLSSLQEHEDSIKSVAFSPDGKLLASGAADGVILFWGLSEAIP